MNPEKYGLTQEEADKTNDVTPTYDLGKLKVGEPARFKLIDNEPQEVNWKDKTTHEEKTGHVLTAIDKKTNTPITLWLTSKSLKQEFYKIAKNHDFYLKDLDIVIVPRVYEHPKYGATRGYTVSEEL